MSNKIDYKLRKDLEGSGSHIVVLDLVGAANHRIIQLLKLNLKKRLFVCQVIFLLYQSILLATVSHSYLEIQEGLSFIDCAYVSF